MGDLKKQASQNLIGRIFETIFVIILPLILVRLLTQNEFGLYQQILLYSGMVVSTLEFNISNSLFYFLPAAKSKLEKSRVINQTFLYLIIVGIAFVLLFYLFISVGVIDRSRLPSIGLDIFPFLLLVFTSILIRPLDKLLIADKNARLAKYYYSSAQIIRTIIIIGSYLVSKNVVSIVWGLILNNSLNALFLILYSKIKYNNLLFRPSYSLFKNQLRYIVPMGMGLIVGILGNNIDKVYLSIFFDKGDFAVYSIGLFKIPLIATIYTSVGNVIMTRLSYNSTMPGGNFLDSLRVWKKMVRLNVVITIPILIFALFNSSVIFPIIFGADYLKSSTVFNISILILFMQMFGYGYILRAYGKTKLVLASNLSKALVIITLGYVLTRSWGIEGAAATATLGYFINGLSQLYFTKKLLSIKLHTLIEYGFIAKILLISLVSSVIPLCFKNLIYDSVYYFIISTIIYFVSIILLLLKAEVAELYEIISLIKGRKNVA